MGCKDKTSIARSNHGGVLLAERPITLAVNIVVSPMSEGVCCDTRDTPQGTHYLQRSRDDVPTCFLGATVLIGGRVGKTTLRHGFANEDGQEADSSALAADAGCSVREMDIGGEVGYGHLQESSCRLILTVFSTPLSRNLSLF